MGSYEFPRTPALEIRADGSVVGIYPGEVVGDADGTVEGSRGDVIGPTHPGGEGGHGDPKQVHPRVAAGEHGGRRDGVLRP